MKHFLLALLLGLGLMGCMGGGTHGSIKCYIYPTSKKELEKAVHHVILENSLIIQDTVKDYYNDDTNYISMSILIDGLPYTYTLKFGGSSQYWDTSKQASVFIAYAHDTKGHGGSSGNGGVKWYNFGLKKRLTEPFEKEFVNKIDSALGVKHTEE